MAVVTRSSAKKMLVSQQHEPLPLPPSHQEPLPLPPSRQEQEQEQKPQLPPIKIPKFDVARKDIAAILDMSPNADKQPDYLLSSALSLLPIIISICLSGIVMNAAKVERRAFMMNGFDDSIYSFTPETYTCVAVIIITVVTLGKVATSPY
jgi:hypothetical protein